jgi:hypothetical protein
MRKGINRENQGKEKAFRFFLGHGILCLGKREEQA